jgi:hypothetical protein
MVLVRESARGAIASASLGGEKARIMHRSPTTVAAALALAAILAVSAATTAVTHAGGPLDGLEELQGGEIGDMNGIVSPTPAVIPTPRVETAPPASIIEPAAVPVTTIDAGDTGTTAADVDAAAPVPAALTAVRLPSTGSGPHQGPRQGPQWGAPVGPTGGPLGVATVAMLLALTGFTSILAARRAARGHIAD